jgi:P-type Ca2+ transporter type 2C
VPADAVVLTSVSLTVDESILTGESVSMRKAAADGVPGAMARPGGDELPFVYSGTLIVQGRGIARVLATGGRTELGRIGKALEASHSEKTPLQRGTGRLVRVFAILGLSLCVIAVISYGLSRGDWTKAVLVGLTNGHVHGSRRDACGAHDLPRPGSLAHFATGACSHAVFQLSRHLVPRPCYA